jgi:hypothetical protein
MQRKLKLSLVLLMIQVSITAILNVWANRVDWMLLGGYGRHAPVHFVYLDFFIIYARLIWGGVNAPAFPFSLLSGNDTWWTGAFGVRGVIYLMEVALLWYLVGRFFDRRRGLELSQHSEITPPKRTVAVLLVIWGVLLLAFSILMIHDSLSLFPNATTLENLLFLFRARLYQLCTLCLFVAWSVVLIVIHGAALVRNRPSKA